MKLFCRFVAHRWSKPNAVDATASSRRLILFRDASQSERELGSAPS
jgi:hypothetical protein